MTDPRMKQKQTIVHKIADIQLPTSEDVHDCDMRGVMMLSSLKWFSSINASEL